MFVMNGALGYLTSECDEIQRVIHVCGCLAGNPRAAVDTDHTF